MAPNRCWDCGDLSAWLFNVDGTLAAICGACVRECIAVSGFEPSMRRLHVAGHGWDLPTADCPVCIQENADLVQRLATW